MNLVCRLAGHSPSPLSRYNGGFHFGACERCGVQMMRSSGLPWQPPPRGHRIVWKSGRHEHSMAPDFADYLPVLAGTRLPARRNPFLSWCRDMVPARRAHARANAGAMSCVERDDEYRHPRLVLVVTLFAAAFSLVTDLISPR